MKSKLFGVLALVASMFPSVDLGGLLKDTRAQGLSGLSARKLVAMAIAIGVLIILLQVLIVPFLNDLAGVNTDNLSGTQQTMVDLLPTILILAVVIVIIFGALADGM